MTAIFTIEINRPEKKNALTMAMYANMAKNLQAADQNPDIRVIVIHGQPGIFTSGNDIHDFLNVDFNSEQNPVFQFLQQISTTTKPIIAAVSGPAIGIGTTMLLHCDLIYADNTAVFQLPFTNLGLCPEAGSSFLLPQLIGYHRAAELFLLGERFTAEYAEKIGLVNKITDNVVEFALTQAEKLARKPPESIHITKKLLKQNVQDIMQQEADLFIERLASPEAKKIFTDFLEKR